jgi:hypothetical protein
MGEQPENVKIEYETKKVYYPNYPVEVDNKFEIYEIKVKKNSTLQNYLTEAFKQVYWKYSEHKNALETYSNEWYNGKGYEIANKFSNKCIKHFSSLKINNNKVNISKDCVFYNSATDNQSDGYIHSIFINYPNIKEVCFIEGECIKNKSKSL